MKAPSKDMALILLSGGMDSLVTTAIANEKHDLALLHLNYGQKTESKELIAFNEIADFYKVPSNLRKVIDTSFLSQIGGSSLTDQKIKVKEFDESSKEIPDSYVPFRNTIIISLAVAYAEVQGIESIYIGAVWEDSSGYPDCRPSYFEALNKLISEGQKNPNIKVITPVINMTKEQIILEGAKLQAPFKLSWSCYSREDVACGKCPSCTLRLRAFEKAGLIDPIPYCS